MSINRSQNALAFSGNGVTITWLPPTITRYNKTINQMAERYDLDPNFIAIIITMESGGNPKARSEAGAVGVMQVTAPTAQDIAARYLKQPVTRYDLQDPATSIEFGCAYFAWLRGQLSSDDDLRTVELISAGYNGGPSAAKALGDGEGLRDIQTVAYSRDAYNMYRERVAKTSPTFDRWKARGGNDLIKAAGI